MRNIQQGWILKYHTETTLVSENQRNLNPIRPKEWGYKSIKRKLYFTSNMQQLRHTEYKNSLNPTTNIIGGPDYTDPIQAMCCNVTE